MGGYADPAAAEANSPYSGGTGTAMAAAAISSESAAAYSAAEGSSTWWASEIAGREAAARASTESSPSESAMTESFYTDPRTGEKWASYAQFLASNPTGVSVPQWSTPGISVVTPTGEIFYSHLSEYWMDPEYTGPEPSLQEKEAYSSAEYAAAFAGTLMEQYDQATLSPAAKQIATTYPKLSTEPVTQAVAQQAAASDLFAAGEDLVTQGLTWLKNNLLIVVIAIAGIIVLPRVISAATPSRRR